jgi:Peptidase family M28/Secretion system C-terminal sorting domain
VYEFGSTLPTLQFFTYIYTLNQHLKITLMRPYTLLLLLLTSLLLQAQNQYPSISNLSLDFNQDSKVLSIQYDLFDAEGEDMEVRFLVSNNNGESFSIPTQNATGDVGSGITSGTGKSITWDATGLLPMTGGYQVKLVADDGFITDIQSIVDQVDSDLLWSTLQFIEGIRHRTANPTHLAAVKDTIEQRFLTANLQTARKDFLFGNYTGQNIIGIKTGNSHSDTTYIVDGHFDTVNDSPGADDNGSAVAGMLEVLRVLAPYRFDKTIKFIGFDLEEEGLKGSLDYTANNISSTETIKGVFNLEMIGYYSDEPNSQDFPTGFELLYPDVQAELQADQFRGNFITNIGDQNSLALIAAFENAAALYVPDLKVISLAAPPGWPVLTPDFGRSDHAPFWLATIPALMLTDGSEFRNPNYHSPNDVVSTLDAAFMTNVVKATVAALAEEAGITHSTTATEAFEFVLSVAPQPSCHVKLSPVPVREELLVDLENCGQQEVDLQVVDVSGKVLVEKKIVAGFSGSLSLNLEQLSAGVYWLKLMEGKTRAETSYQFVKE